MEDRLEGLRRQLIAFRDERDWAQFHTLKNLIGALSVEAGELMELTLWKTDGQFDGAMSSTESFDALKNECADILAYLILISDRAGFDLLEATRQKIEINRLRYPVEKAKGSATKYDRL